MCRVCCVDASRHRSPRSGGHPTCGKVRCGTLAYKIHLEQASISLGKDTHAGTRTNKLKSEEVSTTERAGQLAQSTHTTELNTRQWPRAHARPPAGPGARGDDRPIEVSSASGDPLSAPRTASCVRAARALSLSLSRTHAARAADRSQRVLRGTSCLLWKRACGLARPSYSGCLTPARWRGPAVRIPLGATSERGAKKDTVC